MSDETCGVPEHCICGRCGIVEQVFDQPSDEDYEAKIKSLKAEIAKVRGENLNIRVSRNAALSREKEANINWSKEARGWEKERKALQAEIAALKQPQWVSVEDRLPKNGQKVAVWIEDIFNPCQAYWRECWFISGHWHRNAMDKIALQGGLSITRWMAE